jgi:hypothetical protein
MKIKKLISISMLIIIMISSALITFANDTLVISLQIDNKLALVNGQSTQLATAPYIDTNSGRTLVPLRFVAEEMGYDVKWYSYGKVVELSKTIENPRIPTSGGQPLLNTVVTSQDAATGKNIIRIQINNNTAEQYTVALGRIISGEKSFISKVPDEFIIDNPNYQLQGAIKLEQPPVIKDGYTMVPVRFMPTFSSSNLGQRMPGVSNS